LSNTADTSFSLPCKPDKAFVFSAPFPLKIAPKGAIRPTLRTTDPNQTEDNIFRLLSTHFDSHETDLFLIGKFQNLKVGLWKKYELQKTMKSILPNTCHFAMENQ